MAGEVHKKPEARRDLVEQAAFIAERSLDAAERFLSAAERTFQRLADMPELGTRCRFQNPQAAGIRVWRIEGFKKYLVFYQEVPHGVDIVRVIHGSRDIEAIFAEDSPSSN
jgi:toxin ParE1/3/4